MPNSIETNLNRLIVAKTNIANAITTMGGIVLENHGLEDFSDDISTIPIGSDSLINDDADIVSMGSTTAWKVADQYPSSSYMTVSIPAFMTVKYKNVYYSIIPINIFFSKTSYSSYISLKIYNTNVNPTSIERWWGSIVHDSIKLTNIAKRYISSVDKYGLEFDISRETGSWTELYNSGSVYLLIKR